MTAADMNRAWRIYGAAVEAAEPGASAHCARIIREDDRLILSHPRLGITVDIAAAS